MEGLWERLAGEGAEKYERMKVLVFLGAGGKTTCILELARYLADRGKRVLVTTTVHMESPQALGVPGLVDAGAEEIIEAIRSNGWIMAGRSCRLSAKDRSADDPAALKKIQALEPEVYRKVALEVDMVLVEADGSRKHPIKVPAPWEPVFLEPPDGVYILTGASGLFYPVSQVCHRPEYVEKILGKSEEILTPDRLGILLEKGYVENMKEKFPRARHQVILNQADLLQDPEKIRNLVQEQVSVPVYLRGRARRGIHLILLAAGYSRRFGENKLLYNVNGKPMYAWIFGVLKGLAEQSPEISLTVVSRYDEILSQVKSQGAFAVKNFHSEKGISSSLQLGIRETERAFPEAGEHYFCFFVADQPYLRKETVENFLRTFLESGKKLGAISFGGIPGNPVIFHEDHVPELMALGGDRGGKKILLEHMEKVFLYEAGDEKELRDWDRKDGI